LLQALRPREQQVVTLRFGLMGKPKQSLSQIGKLLKVSKERIRQIQNHTLEKLRAAAEDNHIGDLFLARI
jgi:RNA polymerase primary sigma factor